MIEIKIIKFKLLYLIYFVNNFMYFYKKKISCYDVNINRSGFIKDLLVMFWNVFGSNKCFLKIII